MSVIPVTPLHKYLTWTGQNSVKAKHGQFHLVLGKIRSILTVLCPRVGRTDKGAP